MIIKCDHRGHVFYFIYTKVHVIIPPQSLLKYVWDLTQGNRIRKQVYFINQTTIGESLGISCISWKLPS